jgi:hypothetical protein
LNDRVKSKPGKEASASAGGVGHFFGEVANTTSLAVGQASAFMVAAGVVLVWAITGPLFGYSDTWQLVINTGTSVVTFLMVFLIQNSKIAITRPSRSNWMNSFGSAPRIIPLSASNTSRMTNWKKFATSANGAPKPKKPARRR